MAQIEVRLFTLPLPISTPLYGGARIGKKLYKGIQVGGTVGVETIATNKRDAKKELARKLELLVPGATVVWS